MSCISIIVAVADNYAIGYSNKLIYWLPDDLKRFKALTSGHTIIMGRHTFESLPKGALPNRRNIVLSRSNNSFPGCDSFSSLEEALDSCKNDEEVFVIGGETLYREAISKANKLYITHVYDIPKNADAFFPAIKMDEWEIKIGKIIQSMIDIPIILVLSITKDFLINLSPPYLIWPFDGLLLR